MSDFYYMQGLIQHNDYLENQIICVLRREYSPEFDVIVCGSFKPLNVKNLLKRVLRNNLVIKVFVVNQWYVATYLKISITLIYILMKSDRRDSKFYSIIMMTENSLNLPKISIYQKYLRKICETGRNYSFCSVRIWWSCWRDFWA